jgi:hypothetical protein
MPELLELADDWSSVTSWAGALAARPWPSITAMLSRVEER